MSQSGNQDHDKAFSSEAAALIINPALFPVQRILAHKTVALELELSGWGFPASHGYLTRWPTGGGKTHAEVGDLDCNPAFSNTLESNQEIKKAVSNIHRAVQSARGFALGLVLSAGEFTENSPFSK